MDDTSSTRTIRILVSLTALLLAAACAGDDPTIDEPDRVDVLGAPVTVDTDRGCYLLGEPEVVTTREPLRAEVETGRCREVGPPRFARRLSDDRCFFVPTWCLPDDENVRVGAVSTTCGLNMVSCAECTDGGCPPPCEDVGISIVGSRISGCYGPSVDTCRENFAEVRGTLGALVEFPSPFPDAVALTLDAKDGSGVLGLIGFPAEVVAGWSGLRVDVRSSTVAGEVPMSGPYRAGGGLRSTRTARWGPVARQHLCAELRALVAR